MSTPVKFFLEPDVTIPFHNDEIIAEVTNQLGTQKRSLCWRLTSKGQQKEARLRYYVRQKDIIDGIASDREAIQDKVSKCESKTNTSRLFTVQRVILILNSIVVLIDIAAFSLSPSYTSLLVPTSFLLFNSLRRTIEASNWSSSKIDSIMSLLLGIVLGMLIIASSSALITSKPRSETFTTCSLIVLLSSAALLLVMLNVLSSFHLSSILIRECVIIVVMQSLCCFALACGRQPKFAKCADPIFCVILSLFIIFCWFFSNSTHKQATVDGSLCMARIGSMALEHDRRIECIREMNIDTVDENSIRIDLSITFSDQCCSTEDAIRSSKELREKYLKLDYVQKAFVCCY